MSATGKTPASVLFVTTTSDVGGAEFLLRDLVLRLDPARFAPRVLSLAPLGRVGRDLADRGVPTSSLDLAPEARIREFPRALGALRTIFRREQVDLVHAQLYRANVLACLAARLVRPRPGVVVSQHSLYAMTGPKAEWMARRVVPLADRIIAVSPEVERYVEDDMGAAPDAIHLIENGIDEDKFAPGEGAPLRDECAWPADAFVVGSVGRLSQEKGIDLLLRAAARLCSSFPRLRFAIVGDGPLRGRLEAQSRELGLGERVRFLGARMDVPDLYRAMDLFVLPSRKEAAPLALLEAMGTGLPIVATDVGAVARVVGADAGRVVEPDSEPALESALRELLDDASLRSRLAEAARRRLLACYSITECVRRHETLYEQVLETRG